jgi:hypothetical protein
MSNRLAILAGAGASYGVDAKQYPTTLAFRERLPQNIVANHLFTTAEAFLESEKKQKRPYDIEKILWVLKEFRDFVAHSADASTFINFLLKTGHIGPIAGMGDGQRVVGQLRQGLSNVDTLMQAIHSLVYDLYAAIPREEDLRETWVATLTWALRNFETVDVFTTNYDVVIEEALALIPNAAVSTAHTPRSHGTVVDLEQWRFEERPHGLLTKLHGSINWQYGRSGNSESPIVRVVGPEFFGNHDARAIIYPGFKEAPSKEPFQLFHEYFRARLRAATHLMTVGFAFRDEYINTLVREVNSAKRSTLVIDPTPRPEAEYPPLGDTKFLKQGFGRAPTGLLQGSFTGELDAWLNRA